MVNYKEYETKVYNWLLKKKEKDKTFTFSTRQNGSKGTELDYFIGTEKSKYFGTTFWTIPVAFPGSSSDCINLIFDYKNDKYSYNFRFSQTNSPGDSQNHSALNFLKKLKISLKSHFELSYESESTNKMFTFRINHNNVSYLDLDLMLNEVNEKLLKIIPLVDEALKLEKEVNPEFIGHRITPNDFEKMQQKLERRFEKNKVTLKSDNENIERKSFLNYLKDKEGSNKANSYIRAIDILNEKLERNIYLEKDLSKLNILYQDLIREQRNIDSKYYYKEAPSYGNNGFYSASIKSFMEYLKSDKIISKDSLIEYKPSLNQIFYGPPGTGKTYHTISESAKIINQDTAITYDEALDVFNENLGDQIEFVTFHQNYSYEDFIQGLRPDTKNSTELSFNKTDGVFKRIADRAKKNYLEANKEVQLKLKFSEVFERFIEPLIEEDEVEVKMKRASYFITNVSDKSIEFRKASGGTSHTLSINTLEKMYIEESTGDIQGLSSYYQPLLDVLLDIGRLEEVEVVDPKNYVIIIDEINRANISRVFGELITLIEKDKRLGGQIPIKATLPSGDSFIVPPNLYIIGTMNTADKSIALLDIALRRRFEFVPMYPNSSSNEGKVVYDSHILDGINKEIIDRKGYDFTIGHSYFMGTNYNLKNTIDNKVIPLLLEYFMNDFKEVKSILKNGADLNIDGWPMQLVAND